MTPPANAPQPPLNSSSPDPDTDPRGVPFDLSTLPTTGTAKSKWSPAWIAAAVGLAVFALFFWAYSLGARSQRPLPLGPVKSSAPTSATLRVDVDGAVLRPGVYVLSTDARVSDALAAAGGTLPDADSTALNLAAFVQDGAKISVPLRSAPVVAAPAPIATVPPAAPSPAVTTPLETTLPAQAQAPTQTLAQIPTATLSPAMAARTTTALDLRANPLDLNTATGEQLQRLPGVGPAMAQRILEYRTQNGRFNSVADLDNVKGIGQKRMDEFRDMVAVR